MANDTDSLECQILSEMLRDRRRKAKVSQRQLAATLGKPQSWVCRHEKGDLRMDILELRAYLNALGVSLVSFVSALERKLAKIERNV